MDRQYQSHFIQTPDALDEWDWVWPELSAEVQSRPLVWVAGIQVFELLSLHLRACISSKCPLGAGARTEAQLL